MLTDAVSGCATKCRCCMDDVRWMLSGRSMADVIMLLIMPATNASETTDPCYTPCCATAKHCFSLVNRD